MDSSAPQSGPWLLLLLLAVVDQATGSYRHLYLENADICSKDDGETKELDLGAGSAIFALENASMYKQDKKYRDRYKKCQILVKANEGYGLMVYVEKMNLRQDTRSTASNKCIDYVQFGRDDVIPFLTIYKSGKFCGEQSGVSYDEPGGNLLIWLTLGPSRPSSNRESLSVAKLSLVVTAYQKEGSKVKLTSYRACNSGRRWIRKEYFCDGRTNCALDADPADESVQSCPHKGGDDQTTSGPTGGNGDIHPPLNLISITLVLVSCVVLLVLIALLLLRVKRSGGCCWSGADRRSLCELPEHGPVGLHQLARHPREAGDNLYLPLENRTPVATVTPVTVMTPGHGTTPASSLVNRTTPEQEPPPAYHDLFPADYIFEDKTNEAVEESGEASTSATKEDDDDGIVPEIARESTEEVTEAGQDTRDDVSTGSHNRISVVEVETSAAVGETEV